MDPETEKLIDQIVQVQQKIKKYEEEEEKKSNIEGSSGHSTNDNVLVKLVRNVPLLSELKFEGNVRENIEFFKKMWRNYEKASGLFDEDNNVRVSTMLTAIGYNGYEASKKIYNIMDFQKKMLEVVHGLRGVFVLADDILVVGYDNNKEQAQHDYDENYY